MASWKVWRAVYLRRFRLAAARFACCESALLDTVSRGSRFRALSDEALLFGEEVLGARCFCTVL